MSLFGNMTNEGLEEAEDRLGGFKLFDSDIYNAVIKMAYSVTAPSGARAIFFEFAMPGGVETYRETVYFTSRAGVNFYLTENKKKAPLPGFTLVDDICMFTTDTPLAGQNTEEKVVKVYDVEAKKELPKSVPVLVDLLGKEVSLAIVKAQENKSEKSGNEYVPTAEIRETNNIEKAFHTGTKLTMVEAKLGKTTGEFWDKWLEKNKGQIRDKRKLKGGVGPAAGGPGRAQSGPPVSSGAAAGGAAPQRKSLFGNR